MTVKSELAPIVEHTPGPWEREPGGGRGAWIKGSDGEWAALACGFDHNTGEANARLIAAAPELLAALEAIRAGYPTNSNAHKIAAQAIARARGETTDA